MSVKFEDNTNEVLRDLEKDFDRGLAKASLDLLKDSRMRVPIDTGQLKRSSRSERNSNTSYEVSYNTIYATRQYFENGRKPRWMDQGAKSIANNPGRYFKS